MLSASWPSPPGLGHRTVSLAVRRRVRSAERRALRRAVWIGSWLMAALLMADMSVNLLLRTDGIARLAPYSVAAAASCVAIAVWSRRDIRHPEALAMTMLVIVFAVGLLGLALTPAGRMLGAAQLAIILVGVGLFLPWSRHWHLVGLTVCAALAAGFVVGPLGSALAPSDRGNLLVGVVMAGVTSFVGHALWHARLRSMLVQHFELRELSRYAQRQEASVTELNRELNHMARRDSLTGVGNRMALDEALAGLLDQRDRLRPVPFGILLLDLDEFKAYNDAHGHLAGDAALARLGEILRRATRGPDLAFRYGGEEFLLLMPGVDLNGALAAAERVRLAVMDDETGLPPFTVSGGVAICDPADGRDPEPLLRRADTALYLAKRAGKNRIGTDELSAAMQRHELASA